MAELRDFAAAEIAVAPSGRFVYASVRDTRKAPPDPQNVIAVFSVDTFGMLAPVGHIRTGRWPRGFVIDPGGTFLFVAHETDQTAAAHRLHSRTGLAAPVFEK